MNVSLWISCRDRLIIKRRLLFLGRRLHFFSSLVMISYCEERRSVVLQRRLLAVSVILTVLTFTTIGCERKPNGNDDDNNSCHTPSELVGNWLLDKVIYTTPDNSYLLDPAGFFQWDSNIVSAALTIRSDCTFLYEGFDSSGAVYPLDSGSFTVDDTTFSMSLVGLEVTGGLWKVTGEQLVLTVLYEGLDGYKTDIYLTKGIDNVAGLHTKRKAFSM